MIAKSSYATQILPGLFVGDYNDSKIEQNLSMVINCTPHLPFENSKAAIKIRIPLFDPPSDNTYIEMMFNVLKSDLFEKINENNGDPILIHCLAGAQRSAALCAGYIMWKNKMNALEACVFLRYKRKEAFDCGDPTH